ncbi:MAG: hypothetical protein LW701_03890 [Fluviicola sp.]|nr:hypothetical protein [Fluviicola sp.]
MALGKNMKVDRIIPLEKNKKSTNEDEMPSIDLSLDDFTLDESIDTSATIEFSLDVDNPENQIDLSVNSEEQKLEETIELPTVITPEESKEENKPLFENVDEEFLKIEFTPSRRKTQKRILINIEGSLTINNVEILYSKVNSVFENFDFVEVTLKNVTEIDLTVIQLFHAIRVSYWSLKKYISIYAEFSREDRKLLNTCGFTEFQTQVAATV